MIKAIVTDLSRVLLFPVDKDYIGRLNSLNNKRLAENPEYDFYRYFELNKELIAFYQKVSIPVHVFTSGTIQNHPKLKKLIQKSVDSVISAKFLDYNKSNPKAYYEIAERLALKPNTIILIDDDSANIKAANAAGMTTLLFKDNDSTMKRINNLIATSRSS